MNPLLEEKLEFPFKRVYNEKNEPTHIVLLTAFFRSDAHKLTFIKYRDAGFLMLGITSYKKFPFKVTTGCEDTYHHKMDFDYFKQMRGWLYCFTDPVLIRGLGVPSIDIAESDFRSISHTAVPPPKKYDYIYSCLGGNDCWQFDARNFPLAKKCFPVMSAMGLTGLIVGRSKSLESIPGVTVIPKMVEYHKFQELMSECRFIFAPNMNDASPRVVTEALTKGMPVLMNKHILGGAKYVNPVTGVFFTNEINIVDALHVIVPLSRDPNTRKRIQDWWTERFGRNRSGRRFLEFVKTNYPAYVTDNNTGLFL